MPRPDPNLLNYGSEHFYGGDGPDHGGIQP